MKTFDKKDVYSWSNAEEAKQYIGKAGYFADNLNDLQECVSNNNFQTLFSLDLDPETDVDSIFSITEIDYKYALFIPADKVKAVEEKKYRPFKSFSEFYRETNTDVGDSLELKSIRGDIVQRVLVSGVRMFPDHSDEIFMTLVSENNSSVSFNYLFDSYLWHDTGTGEWKPMGIEKKDFEA